MGQYHYVANLDKKELLHPHQFGDGLKMMEFGRSGDGTLLGLTVLLACSHNRGGGDLHVDPENNPTAAAICGRWAGDRIAIVGDYANPNDFPGLTQQMIDDIRKGDSWTDISEHVIKVIELDAYTKQSRSEGIRFSQTYHRSVLHPDGTITAAT